MPHQHVWTFAAGDSQDNVTLTMMPALVLMAVSHYPTVPAFFGDDY